MRAFLCRLFGHLSLSVHHRLLGYARGQAVWRREADCGVCGARERSVYRLHHDPDKPHAKSTRPSDRIIVHRNPDGTRQPIRGLE